jgi:signal transduction histidine kinase
MYLFVLLTTIFPQLPFGWAVGYTAGITALALWRQISLAERLADPLALVILFAAASAIGLAAAIQAVVRQSVERACLIAELEAARDALAASERHAGMLAERQRLAREIHDTLAQAFISIVTHLEAADAALIGDPTVMRPVAWCMPCGQRPSSTHHCRRRSLSSASAGPRRQQEAYRP